MIFSLKMIHQLHLGFIHYHDQIKLNEKIVFLKQLEDFHIKNSL
jgi:hypothetical protein